MDTEITVSDGATEALFSTIHAVVRPGDEVIVFDPAYDSYEPAVKLAGGTTRHLPLVTHRCAARLPYRLGAARDALSPKTRLIILNFPHNPTGAILRAGRPRHAGRRSFETLDVYLLSDEVYEHIVFDGEEHLSLLGHDELLGNGRSLCRRSARPITPRAGKSATASPRPLTAEFRKVHQWTCYAVVTPIQHALADHMRATPDHYSRSCRRSTNASATASASCSSPRGSDHAGRRHVLSAAGLQRHQRRRRRRATRSG